MKDFTPIIFVANLPLIMTINAGRPEKSVAEVIASAKANPGKFSFASSGNGGAPHLSGELFKIVAGIEMLHVPYRGSGPAVIDVGAGRVDIMFDAVPSLLAVDPGREASSAGGGKRGAQSDRAGRADLRRARHQGHGRFALVRASVGPAGLPQPIVQRLNAEFGENS